jgi:ATP-dependent helicase/nuclease subunit A
MHLEQFGRDFELTDRQRLAVGETQRDVLVTAGAGSGKTRTLVTRYLWLLANGAGMREVLAITFTEKAAREMRNRVRIAIGQRAGDAQRQSERALWADHIGAVDAARIGTIHSFCAELLRAHPAEAGVDPEFEVVEEGRGTLYKAQAVKDALVWASGEDRLAPLFRFFSPRRLAGVLDVLLGKRLDLGAAALGAGVEGGGRALLRSGLFGFLERREVRESIERLRSLHGSSALREDAGEKLATQVEALVAGWDEVEALVEADRLAAAAHRLFHLRREHMALNVGKRDSQAKAATRMIRRAYEEMAEPWLGGKASDQPPDSEWEREYEAAMRAISPLFTRALEGYRQLLGSPSGLDFDDLEQGAVNLLSNPRIRSLWQERISHVLVDEFQDTNSRQRDIVRALTADDRGKLFLVGDARQSIYRFRGAEVEVFRQAGRDLARSQGRSVQLGLTFRPHSQLLSALDDLLAAVMGTEEDPEHLHRVPYRTLQADRSDPRGGIRPPYVEFILGRGDRAAAGRSNAAGGLAARLLALKSAGQIREWDDVALLFRASTAFEVYESALEGAGIPFVTVAGRGFFHRPEIRDVLNILRAVAEPWNEVALAGLLRSPAFGLSDAGLYQLRFAAGHPQGLRQALDADIEGLADGDRRALGRVRQFLAEFEPLADRQPASELLKGITDWLRYRAILGGAKARLWRNLDKLQSDAHASDAVQVRDFLEYVGSLRDVGAREGEAPVEAEGAVRLMTIHKAKGLEFELVVLADASRNAPTRGELVYGLPEGGVVARPDREKHSPLVFSVSKWIDAEKSSAEEDRLLYVAATRAREKWIISGHISGSEDRPRADGWTGALLTAAGVSPADVSSVPEGRWSVELPGGQAVGIQLAGEAPSGISAPQKRRSWPENREPALFGPMVWEGLERLDDEMGRVERSWRATAGGRRAPAVAIGGMVHEAIRRWESRTELAEDSALEALALAEGLVDPSQRSEAVRVASGLLRRLRDQPLWEEIISAEVRRHEVPYTRPTASSRSESGRIDLLYRDEGGWNLIDFKTDELRNSEALAAAVEEYAPQIVRYSRSVQALIGSMPVARLCFLDYRGKVWLHEVEV